jgi:DsbC/DsbD-like thiol-disulfide interchange protein
MLTAAWPAAAGESSWQRAQFASLRLIYMPAGASDADFLAGLQVRPDRGYKLFWRAPGAFGIAPNFAFSGSANLGTADVLWPVPRRLTVEGATGTAIGYDRETVFPIKVKPADPRTPVELHRGIRIAHVGARTGRR